MVSLVALLQSKVVPSRGVWPPEPPEPPEPPVPPEPPEPPLAPELPPPMGELVSSQAMTPWVSSSKKSEYVRIFRYVFFVFIGLRDVASRKELPVF